MSWTKSSEQPAAAELALRADGGVLALPVTEGGEGGKAAFIGAVADLQANLARSGQAARRTPGLDAAVWPALAERVQGRTGLLLILGRC